MLKQLRQKLYRIKKRTWPKAIIICYHRVADYNSDPVNITVTPKNFHEHIQFLNNNYNIINLKEVFECLISRKDLPRNSIVITFDDGYQCYDQIIKYLHKYSITATFFTCTPAKKYFYWDILSYLLIDQIEINKDNLDFINDLCSFNKIEIEPEPIIDSSTFKETLKWKMYSNTYPSNRCKIYELLAAEAEFDNGYINNNLINRLYSREYDIDNEKSFFINKNNLDLSSCNIGGHTLNHYCLSSLNKDEQKKEILSNRNHLKDLFNKEINFFAYPFGTRNHYNKYSLEIVKKNFLLGLSNFPGQIHKESNLFELPRFLIRDWGIDTFKLKINNFFEFS